MKKITLTEFCDQIEDLERFERCTSYYSGFGLLRDPAEWVEEFLKFYELPPPTNSLTCVVDEIIDRIENDEVVE